MHSGNMDTISITAWFIKPQKKKLKAEKKTSVQLYTIYARFSLCNKAIGNLAADK